MPRVWDPDPLTWIDSLEPALMLWGTVWPVCPAHNLGAHAQEHDGAAVWWCKHP